VVEIGRAQAPAPVVGTVYGYEPGVAGKPETELGAQVIAGRAKRFATMKGKYGTAKQRSEGIGKLADRPGHATIWIVNEAQAFTC
jgi:hypothetical protein